MKLNRVGEQHGMLTVIAEAEPWIDGSQVWLCRCACGGSQPLKKKEAYLARSGFGKKSCGCVARAARVNCDQAEKVRDMIKSLRKNPEFREFVYSRGRAS